MKSISQYIVSVSAVSKLQTRVQRNRLKIYMASYTHFFFSQYLEC